MQSLGGTLSADGSRAWLERQLDHWDRHGYGRFFVSVGDTFIGVVGLSRFDFDRGIVPGIEIAWRLGFDAWGHGYATEAARAAIDHGFSTQKLSEIFAITHVDNLGSRRVMERLGMRHLPEATFEHPLLAAGDPLRTHVVYQLRANDRS